MADEIDFAVADNELKVSAVETSSEVLALPKEEPLIDNPNLDFEDSNRELKENIEAVIIDFEIADNESKVSTVETSSEVLDLLNEEPLRATPNLGFEDSNQELKENIEDYQDTSQKKLLFPGEEIIVFIFGCVSMGVIFHSFIMTIVTLALILFLRLYKEK